MGCSSGIVSWPGPPTGPCTRPRAIGSSSAPPQTVVCRTRWLKSASGPSPESSRRVVFEFSVKSERPSSVASFTSKSSTVTPSASTTQLSVTISG